MPRSIRHCALAVVSACLLSASAAGITPPAKAAGSAAADSPAPEVTAVDVKALFPAAAGPVPAFGPGESAHVPLREQVSAHRQPVLIVLKDGTGKLASKNLSVTLEAAGPGEHAIYASPFAPTPLGKDRAVLQTYEGVAVAYTASTMPGTVQYHVTLPDQTGAQDFVGSGVFSAQVPAAQRVGTVSLSYESRGPIAAVTVGVRDLYGLPLTDGPVGVRLYLWGAGADELAKSLAHRGLSPSRSALPGAGTPAWQLTGVARNGQWSVTYPVPGSGQVQFLAVPDTAPAAAQETGLRTPLVALRPPVMPAGGEKAAAKPAPVSTSSTVRVVTYNIQHGADSQGNFHLDGTAQTLNAANFDVATLQEVEDGWARSNFVDEPSALGRATQAAAVFGSALIVPPQGDRPDAPGMFGNAILSRAPVRAATALSLPSLVLPKRYTEPRTLLSAQVDTPGGPAEFFGTHLDLNQGERILQSGAILEYISSLPADRVGTLSGDFNVTPGGPEVTLLSQSPLFRDAWAEKGTGDGFTYPANHPSERIDFIFVPGRWAVESADVIPAAASDHLPVESALSPAHRR